MADTTRLGRIAQFGDQISLAGDTPEAAHCGQCEPMLADALDGTLSREDQAVFDAHIAACAPCATMLADATRGLRLVSMLHDARPEPSPGLADRILAATSGLPAIAEPAAAAQHEGSAQAPRQAWGAAGVSAGGRIAAWRERIRAALHGSALLQPRLAMTTAMAFFSIALTLNLTGVRLRSVRVSDLTPSGLRRGFYRADARLVQYYEGLRVVYELESRVHDLESEPDSGSSPDTAAPASAPGSIPSDNAQPAATGIPPAGRSPAQPSLSAPNQASPNQPGPGKSSPAQPGSAEPNRSGEKGKAPGPGTSRRESPFPHARLFAAAAEAGGGSKTGSRAASAGLAGGGLKPGSKPGGRFEGRSGGTPPVASMAGASRRKGRKAGSAV